MVPNMSALYAQTVSLCVQRCATNSVRIRDYQANLAAFERLKQRLSNADGDAILRLKDVCCQQGNYRVEVQSVQIYEAVSEYGIKER